MARVPFRWDKAHEPSHLRTDEHRVGCDLARLIRSVVSFLGPPAKLSRGWGPFPRSMLQLVPVTHRRARAFIADLHRHNRPPVQMIFTVGAELDGVLVGVATAGRPVARELQDGKTLEITRVCTDASRNVCSMLYGACRRAGLALGYRRFVTYTLISEPGASLKASGFRAAAELKERRSWGSRGRVRYDTDLFGNKTRDQGPKIRWEWP